MLPLYTVLFIAVLIVSELPCSARGSHAEAVGEVESALSWVEKTDATSLLQDDAKQNRRRFLSVCGFACLVPGVGAINAERCYSEVAVEIIRGTADVIRSERHSQLQQKAGQLARQFNILVAASERRAGRAACGEAVDWDAALTELGKLVWSLETSTSSRGQVTLLRDGPVFLISLPDDTDFESIHQAACNVLEKNGLRSQSKLVVGGLAGSFSMSRAVLCS
jgi:hypothetical protein